MHEMGPAIHTLAIDCPSTNIGAATPRMIRVFYISMGVSLVTAESLKKREEDVGNIYYGVQETIIIFENSFIPWEHVYMLGETEFSGMLVERFAGYHRQSYGGGKPGNRDELIGASLVLAEYNGCAKSSHIKDKFI